MIKNVLFDLDGTLLGMDQDAFVACYFQELTKKMKNYGYDSELLSKVLWQGVLAMMQNDGSKTNEEVFWRVFAKNYGEIKDKNVFEEFYRNEFQSVSKMVAKKQNVSSLLSVLKDKKIQPILATAPLFPGIATRSRVKWAGMNPDDFSYISTYENSHYSKPSLKYYEELLVKNRLLAEQCIMIGNDTEEDMIAEKLGMQVYLVTDFLVNKHNYDIENWNHGTFDEMIQYLEEVL